MRLSTVGILATAIGLASASLAHAQGIPGPVRATIQEMDDMCRSSGGAPGSREGLMLSADINGDGVRDWVIDQVAYQCSGAVSLFSGSRGGDILVFAGTRNGGATEPTYFNGYGARLEEGLVWLRLAGSWCGQRVTDATSTSELQGCDRAVIWTGDRFDVGEAAELPGMAEVPPPPPPPGKPGATAGGASAWPNWFVGAWVGEGNYCDSGSPVDLRADGSLMNELFSGNWSVDGDVLTLNTRSIDEVSGDPVGDWGHARYRVERLDDNRAEWIPLDGGRSHVALRCPYDGM